MRTRWLLTQVLALSASPLLAQAPLFPGPPAEPRPLPPGFNQPKYPGPSSTMPAPALQAPALAPSERGSTPARTDVKLPQKEQILRVEGSSIIVRRQNDNWQLWAGTTLLREFGKHQSEAEDAVRQMRELRPTEWVSIGTGRPVVEYGLTKGEAFIPTYEPKHSSNVDLKSVRAENVRGAWILRDDSAILLNFGADRAGAEQAAAVVQRYGFNRLGWVGDAAPQMTYFYAMSGQHHGGAGFGAALKSVQEQNLTRTGIDVAGLGFVGERIVIDSAKCEIRKEKGEWVIAHGADVLATFGPSEWSARDALKIVKDLRFTEFCRFSPEVTFFLVNGQAPTKVPFSVQAARFDPEGLKVRPSTGGQFALFDGGYRQVFGPMATQQEAEQLLKLLKHYKFDQTCQQGLSSRGGLKFLAKNSR